MALLWASLPGSGGCVGGVGVGMGALLPSWLGESLAGLVVVYAGWLCQLTVRLAIAARDDSAQSMAFA